MKPQLMAHWVVFWGNPYTQPPEGKPRELLRIAYPYAEGTGEHPPEVEETLRLNPGYSIGWQSPVVERDPARLWTPERKATARRANLRKRLERDAPLFMEELFAAALARQPEYFAGK